MALNTDVGQALEQSLTPKKDVLLEGEVPNWKGRMKDYVKPMFASMETSGNMTNYLQLEKTTFDDLVARRKVSKDIEFKHLVDPKVYDKVAEIYIDDLMSTFEIPTIEEAALWSYRPGWYKKYEGKINKIPGNKRGSFGKSGVEVMKIRDKLMKEWMKKQ